MQSNIKKAAIVGEGFIGKNLRQYFEENKIECFPYNGKYDLRHYAFARVVSEILADHGCSHVYNLVGYNGGIEFNRKNQHEIFFTNTTTGLNFISASSDKPYTLINMITSCAYPNNIFSEESKKPEEILIGQPEENVMAHGYARRNIYLAHKFFSEKTNLKSICFCPNTVYGPGDSLDETRCKVVSSMIIKFLKAVKNNDNSITLFGDGSPTRQLIYVKDLVKMLGNPPPAQIPIINLADPNKEIPIYLLANLIKNETGFSGEIIWDKTKPNGQKRKNLDLDSMYSFYKNVEFTSLFDSLKETVEYYKGKI